VSDLERSICPAAVEVPRHRPVKPGTGQTCHAANMRHRESCSLNIKQRSKIMDIKTKGLGGNIDYLKDELECISDDVSELQRDLMAVVTDDVRGAFSRLREGISFVSSELSRLKGDIEFTDKLNDDQMTPRNPTNHCGQINLPIHYTFGIGVAEANGDRLENAVLTAFREATRDIYRGRAACEVNYCGVGMVADLHWDKELRVTCLHLELIRTEDQIVMDEFDTAEYEIASGVVMN
jgi:hypothetical protein